MQTRHARRRHYYATQARGKEASMRRPLLGKIEVDKALNAGSLQSRGGEGHSADPVPRGVKAWRARGLQLAWVVKYCM